MRKTLNILASSLRLTLQELRNNKLRTALSLTGIAFGIFCIIGVLAFVTSLERNIQNNIASLGTNTIYIDKWAWNRGPDLPFWKLRSRPLMKYEETEMIRQRSDLSEAITFFMSVSGNLSFKDDVLEGVNIYGINAEQIDIQPMSFAAGRYISSAEFNNISPVAVIGYNNAEKLYGTAERALGKTVELKGRKLNIVGVISKAGQGGPFNFDECIMIPYKLCRQLFEEKNTNPLIIVKGKKDVSTAALTDELTGIMRQIRRLSPTQEDNFSLNNVEAISKAVSGFFVILNIVGSIIGGISLIVGMFGIANIMFVTVKERTPVIGLKKAIGAKSSTVLFEFLAEAALLCLLGGFVGIIFVWILTIVLSGPFEFPIYISFPLLGLTFLLCLVVGILAGIIPARRAAKMDPVVAIRS
jgi:putative ABC transport system permease protein